MLFASLFAAALAASAAAASERVVLRGVAVCLDGEGTVAAVGEACPDEPEGGWALRTSDGVLHALEPDDPRIAMLNDTRVRSRELQVTAWRDGSGRLAVVHLRTIVGDALHDPHYFCDVCQIRAHARGPCWCCQAPFAFREPPTGEEPDGGS